MFRSRLVIALLAVFFTQVFTVRSVQAALTVTPSIHRSGEEGYFSVVVPLDEKTAAGPLWVEAQPEQGDIYLVNASLSPQKEENKTERTVTVAGRYGKPGRATVVIRGRDVLDPSGKFKTLLTVDMDLPATAPADPGVMKTWADLQQRRIASAFYGGGDSFSTYWNLAAAPRYGLQPSEPRASRSLDPAEGQPDLYDIFTSAAAIQESLQLETLGSRGRPVRTVSAKSKKGAIPISSLPGPDVKSHPFAELLKGKKPKLPALSTLIPDDQYAVFFTDINKQIEFADMMEDWGGSLLETVHASSRDFHIRKKMVQQLCLETGMLTRLFGDRIVGSMAFTGSDPFFREGTDFAVLFTLKDQYVFLEQMKKRYAEAAAGHKAVRAEFSSGGRKHISVTSFDRRVSSYLVVFDNVAVVSNSLEAMARIIQTASGKIKSLHDAPDFQYMRTIFREGDDDNEDIFIYLSDAHIRKLVGPVSKIEEARRETCAANLQILANARFWYKSERHREPSLQNLRDEGYLGKADLACPEGGAYSLDRSTGEPGCSVHNRTGYLTPVASIKPGNATEREADQYKGFVDNYNRYWTRFFDPIGIRVKMREKVRIETCILPLIENSWYDGLAAFSGREPGKLTETAVLPRTIISLRGRMSPEWLKKLEFINRFAERWKLPTTWLGDEISLNLCDGPVLFTVDGRAAGLLGRDMGRASLEPIVIGYILSAINLPTYLAVKVNDADAAEHIAPLVFRSLTAEYGGPGRDFSAEAYSLEPYRGKKISVLSFAVFMAKFRLYAAVIDDRLIIASRRDIVTDLIDGSIKGQTAPGNLEFSIYRTAFHQIEPTFSLGYQEDIRRACRKNLALADTLLNIGNVSPDDFKASAFALRGYEPYCPAGGRYSIDPETHRAVCSVHGGLFDPIQPVKSPDEAPIMKAINSLKKINARLTFTPEGLMATVELQRNK